VVRSFGRLGTSGRRIACSACAAHEIVSLTRAVDHAQHVGPSHDLSRGPGDHVDDNDHGSADHHDYETRCDVGRDIETLGTEGSSRIPP
jgi:hypothetical protein